MTWAFKAKEPHGYDILSGGFHIAECHNEGDARLIAAAPEMLAALEGIVDTDYPTDTSRKTDVDLWFAMIHAARAAIAKAKGE